MSSLYGLADECIDKLSEDITDPNSVFAKINQTFEYMPIAAIAEEKILCVHGGIGSTLRSIEEIELIPRPLEIIHD
jgi:protein phosphatase